MPENDLSDSAADPFGATPLLLTPDEVRSWILVENDEVIVFNKPGWVVCHPSKNGPFSSLVGAAREVLGLDRVHLISRLDRETSGLVVLARDRLLARRLQMAMAARQVSKRYRAILHGRLAGRVEVSQPLGPDPASPVAVKQCVQPPADAQKAQTTFIPLAYRGGFTLAEVIPHTGRKHQIRAHAQWIGHAVAGDKVYGPDPTLYLEFIEHGWTPHLAAALPLARQALHAARLDFETGDGAFSWEAPLSADLEAFWEGLPPDPSPVPAPAVSGRRRRRGGPAQPSQ